jgi:hypothetical protein
VRKPNKQDFVRVHQHPSYRMTPAAIEVKEDHEVYLVHRTAAPWRVQRGDAVPHTINRRGVLRLWPVKLLGPDGKHNEWHRSAGEAAERAMKKWVRVTANMSLGAYDIFEAINDLHEPVWPDISFDEILKIAFRRHIVDLPITPWCRDFRGCCKYGEITRLSPSDRSGRRRQGLPKRVATQTNTTAQVLTSSQLTSARPVEHQLEVKAPPVSDNHARPRATTVSDGVRSMVAIGGTTDRPKLSALLLSAA